MMMWFTLHNIRAAIRTLFLTACALVTVKPVYAQDTIVVPHPVKAYLNMAGGINSCNGLGGLQVEYYVQQRLSVIVAGGLGSWGLKFAGGARFYLKDRLGPAASLSYSSSTGIKQIKISDMEVINQQGVKEVRSVDFLLRPLQTINIGLLQVWRLGQEHNRFYIEAGYSIPLQGKSDRNYGLLEPLVITNEAKRNLRMFQPGGWMLSMGFSFPF
jgi:hypothetical protein